MATLNLSANISIFDGQGSTIDNMYINLPTTNISSNVGSVLNFKRVAKKPFIIGASKIGDGSTYEKSVDYLIIQQLSNKETGRFDDDIEITINGKNLDHFEIAFDTINNQHPTYIIVDGERYKDDDALFTIGNLIGDTHTIIIQDWNNKGYPCVITGIYGNISIDIDYKNLISFSRTLQDRSDFEQPSYGVVATSGNLEFNDTNLQVLDYAKQKILKPDLDVNLYINEKISNTQNLVGKFKTDKWTYDDLNFKVSVDLKDDLLEWQKIYIDFDNFYRFMIQENITAYDLYLYLRENTPSRFQFIQLDNNQITYLQSITIKYFYFKDLSNSSLWNLWNKFCYLVLYRIYKNNNGEIEVR